MSAEATATELVLSTIAARANDEHAAAEAAAAEAVIHARNAGQALLEAKVACRRLVSAMRQELGLREEALRRARR